MGLIKVRTGALPYVTVMSGWLPRSETGCEGGKQGHRDTRNWRTVEVIEDGKSKAATTFSPQKPQRQSCRLRFRGIQGGPRGRDLEVGKLSERQI